jgi:hypothetical protein
MVKLRNSKSLAIFSVMTDKTHSGYLDSWGRLEGTIFNPSKNWNIIT